MSNSKKDLEQQILDAATTLFFNENKIYSVAQLTPRFKQAAENYRYDSTINQVAHVLELAANKNPDIEVTPNDLKKLANQFWSSSTNFSTEFADLLDQEASSPEQKSSNRIAFETETKDIKLDGAYSKSQTALYDELANHADIVDLSLSYTPEELQIARTAAMLIDQQFKQTQKIAKIASVLKHKTSDLFVFESKIKTATTEATVYVPVEVSDSVPLFPEVMSTTDKVYTLDRSGIEQLTADLESEKALRQANNINNLRTAEDYEIALRNDNMNKYAEEVDEYEVAAPSKQAFLAESEVEEVLKQAVLAKQSKFSSSSREEARSIIASSLKQVGFSNTQIKFAGDTENGLSFSVSLSTENGKLEAEIPVEIDRSIILPPTTFTVAGEAHDFTKQAFDFVTKTTSAVKVAINPLLVSMSYPDLKKQLKNAAHTKNHKLAQQIVELIDEKFGENYRNSATDDYQTWLEEASQSYESRCNGCNFYTPKTSTAGQDYCNLIKTAAKNVNKDRTTGICTRSTYASEKDSFTIDSGLSLKFSLED